MNLEKTARHLRSELREKNKEDKKEGKINDPKPKFVNHMKIKLDRHFCPGCDGHYISKQALWRHIRKDHKEIQPNIDLKYKVCQFCGKHKKAMRQHIKKFHSHEEEPSEVVKVVKIEFKNPGPKSRPRWADLVAQAIGASGGLATLLEIASWILETYPIFSANNVSLKKIYTLVNNATNEYKNLWLKTVTQPWGPQQWYVLEDEYLHYVKNRRKKRKEDVWNFKP